MARKNDGASANSKRGEPPPYLSEDQAYELLRDAWTSMTERLSTTEKGCFSSLTRKQTDRGSCATQRGQPMRELFRHGRLC